MTVGKYYLTLKERIRVQQQWHLTLPQPFYHAYKPLCVVSVPMAEHNCVELFRIHIEHIHIVYESVFTQARIKKQGFRCIATNYSNQRCKTMLGYESLSGESIRS